MTPEQAAHYIGHEYKAGANGPEEWDCWHFLQHVLKTYFGTHLTDAPIGDMVACKAIYDEHIRTGRWTPTKEPQHGDAVRMREGRWPHVGIYLDIDGGKILHCVEGHGVIASRVSTLNTMSFGRITYYRITKQ